MPSSRPNTIPMVISLLRQIKPRSILDVGVGFGKWGHLFREYTDINESEHDPARYQRENWKVRIDGIEGHAPYLTEMHRYLYNDIHVGDVRELLPQLDSYDLIFLGDIIEHLEKQQGFDILDLALTKARKAVLVSTPKYETAQADLCDNELERHLSLWRSRDFRRFEGAKVKTIGQDTLLVVLPKPAAGRLRMILPTAPDPALQSQLQDLIKGLQEHIPLAAPFILIDDEQVRHRLPHRQVLPFLEKDGQYWGPPADDLQAIRELKRLKASGARYLAVISPSFWWLDHYVDFFKHVRENHACPVEHELLVLYDLAGG